MGELSILLVFFDLSTNNAVGNLNSFFLFFPVYGVGSIILTADFGFNRSGGFLDLETDTNPIDRSVAHLLFHRPSDPSAMPAGGNTLPQKSHKLVILIFQCRRHVILNVLIFCIKYQDHINMDWTNGDDDPSKFQFPLSAKLISCQHIH